MAEEEAKSAEAEKRPRGRPRTKGGTTSTTIRLPKWLRDKLAEVADEEDRTQTALIRRALEAYLAGKGAEETEE